MSTYEIGSIVFDKWKICRELGQGSYGTVYEIQREDFGGVYKAALKVITVPQSRSELQSVLDEGMTPPQAKQYFYSVVEDIGRECAIMSRLKGTGNIVSYEDHAVLRHPDGIGWDILIRMELLHPLLPYVYQHPMARRDIIRLGIDICKALELCQRYNIIHRDIKPENIFISDNGDYKLGDFGIARTIERTSSGLSKKGTYSYMAPEVYAGKEYGFSVDTYSLGLVLYRMLNKNRGPFLPQPPEAITFSSREQALARRMSGEPLPRPFYGEGHLGEIVLKACAFDPKERYSSPQQLRQELEAILYTQTDAAVIYPDGDELTIDREPYASVRRPAAPGQAEPKPMDATQGVFTDTPRTESEPTAEDRTRPAFDAEKPKRTSTKKKRKKKGRFIIGICAICLLIPAVLYVIGILPDPYYSFIHNIFEPQTIPEALQEYEEAGTLEKLYENGMLTGYRIKDRSTIIEGLIDNDIIKIFDTAGNCVREEFYDLDGTLICYVLSEYDLNGNCMEERGYEADGALLDWSKFEYDSDGNRIKAETYDPDGTYQGYVLYEYDSNQNQIKAEMFYSDGTARSSYILFEYDDSGNMTKEEAYINNELDYSKLYTYDINGEKIEMQFYYKGELSSYAKRNETGEWVRYDADGTPQPRADGYVSYNADGTPRE